MDMEKSYQQLNEMPDRLKDELAPGKYMTAMRCLRDERTIDQVGYFCQYFRDAYVKWIDYRNDPPPFGADYRQSERLFSNCVKLWKKRPKLTLTMYGKKERV